jgi:hypothetical protein
MSTAVLSGIFTSIVLSSICRNRFQFVFLFVKDGGLVHSTVEVLRELRTGEWSDDKSKHDSAFRQWLGIILLNDFEYVTYFSGFRIVLLLCSEQQRNRLIIIGT